MKYIAAYLLAQAGGEAAPNKAKITAILESVGIQVDEKAVDALLEKLNGKNIEELIKEGSEKLAVVGGGAAQPLLLLQKTRKKKRKKKKKLLKWLVVLMTSLVK